MTQSQRIHFLGNLWPALCRKLGWDKSDRAARLDFLSRALNRPISSANDLNNTTDFDTVKAEALAIIEPDNLEMQLDQARQNLKRRRWAIAQLKKMADDAYLRGLLRSDRFKRTSLEDLETMPEKEFNQFRFTVINRTKRKTDNVPF
jgi:hypothetical protein